MKNETILNKDLKNLIERFQDTDVIPAIEQNYARERVEHVELNLIDDNQFIKKAKISEKNLKEYEENIQENGLLRPLIIRKVKDRYEIVIGRRLFIACKKLKLHDIPVIIENFNDEETLLILLADTLEQRSYNIIEVAYLLLYLKNNFKYKNKDLAKLIRSSESQVSNILQLLNLPKEILRDIVNNKLSYGHAKAISRLNNEEAIKLTSEIYQKNLSVREVEEKVTNLSKKIENRRVFYRNKKITIYCASIKERDFLLKEIIKLINK